MTIKNIYPPIIICGSHGSGTSYVTKLMRWGGLFVGADSGAPTNRKIHESHVYTRTNEAILQELMGGCTFGMRTVNPEEWARYFAVMDDPNARARALSKIDMHRIRKKYWGGRKPWGRLLEQYRLRKVPWGWKDPRNSLTLPFWLEIYPDARVLVLTKEWALGKKGKSGSGSWFKEESTPEVREIYMNPLAIRETDRSVYRFNFSEVNDHERVNALFAWVGIKTLDAEEYEVLLHKTGYERPNQAMSL